MRNLRVVYKSTKGDVVALDGIDIDIERNEFIAVVGESGCGKSTLALSVIGLLPKGSTEIKEGSISYKDKDLTKLNNKQRRNYRGTEIAMIFQQPLTSLNPVFRVGDQIAEAIMVRDSRQGRAPPHNSEVMQSVYNRTSRVTTRPNLRVRKSTRLLLDEITHVLQLVRIADPKQVVDRYPFELSGGMIQRIMIAMALSEKPSLLIADEPTTALDTTTQAQVLKLMKDLIDTVQATILLITHDLAVASEVADRVLIMYAGEIVEDTGVIEFFSEPLHPYSKGLLSCIPSGSKTKTRLQPIPGSIPDPASIVLGCKYAERCKFAMEKCRQRRPRLLEVRPKHKVSCFLYGE